MTAPSADPVCDGKLQKLVDFITGCNRIVVLTGAGVSTESRIPDYRGPAGAYTTGYKPMSHQQVGVGMQGRLPGTFLLCI